MKKRKFNEDIDLIDLLSPLKAEILQLNKENIALQLELWGNHSTLIFLKALVEASYSMKILKASIQNSRISSNQKQILLSGIHELPEEKHNTASSQESEAILGLLTLNSPNLPAKKHQKSSHVEYPATFSAIKTMLTDEKSATISSESTMHSSISR